MEGVRAQVASMEREGGVSQDTKARIENLEEWKGSSLEKGAFSVSGPKYHKLKLAIMGGAAQNLAGLNDAPIPPHTIGQTLYAKGSKATTPTGRPAKISGPPLFEGGTFNLLLPSLIELVCSQIDVADATPNSQMQFVSEIASIVLREMDVSLLPWEKRGEEGNVTRWAQWDSWRLIAGSQPRAAGHRQQQPIIFISDDESDGGAGPSSSSSYIVGLPGSSSSSGHPAPVGEWLPNALPLCSLKMIIRSPQTPDELRLVEKDSPREIIQSCVSWAIQNYDVGNKVHKLCLVVAFMVNKKAPCYLVGKDKEWTSAGSQYKQSLQRSPRCFGLALMYLLCMLDKRSPIRVREGTSGRDWGETMSE